MKRALSATGVVILILSSAACWTEPDEDLSSDSELMRRPKAPAPVTSAPLLELAGTADRLELRSAPAREGYRAEYPNPKGIGRMSVAVESSGNVVAKCTDASGKARTCLDTPFFTHVEHVADGTDVHVLDVYGVECAMHHFDPPSNANDEPNGGYACTSSSGSTTNSCSDQEAIATRDAYCGAINRWLKKHDMRKIDCADLDGPGYDKMPDAKRGVKGACDDIWGDPYVNIVMRWTKGCACYAERTVHWNNAVRWFLIKHGACAHSPLVLDLDGDGIELGDPEHGVDFDLLASGEPVSTAWPGARDGLLALDRNGNGRIDDGTELFGESTAGLERSDGFSALSELDANGDGILDRRDPGFAHLVVWRDRNRDGKSAPDELASLDEVGVRSLDVLPARIHGDAVFDPKGNRIPLVASFERADGSRARLVDAFFRYRPR